MTQRQGVRQRIGYRGLTLTFFGSMFAVIGAGVAVVPPYPTPTLPHTLLPVWVRVAMWGLAGVIAVAAGLLTWFTPKWQVPAFVALIIPPTERALSYTYASWAEWPGNHAAAATTISLFSGGLAALLLAVGVLITRPDSTDATEAKWRRTKMVCAATAAGGVGCMGIALLSWSPTVAAQIQLMPWSRITAAAIYWLLSGGLMLFASWPEPTPHVTIQLSPQLEEMLHREALRDHHHGEEGVR